MKKKLENFWFYHKVHCAILLLALVLLGDFAWQKLSEPKADYQAALVLGGYAGEQTCQELAQALGEVWAAGQQPARVEVPFYPYDGETLSAEDPAAFMAGGVQLAADLKNGVSVCYLTDTPQLLLAADAGLVCEGVITESSPLWQVAQARGLAVLCLPQNKALAQRALGG